MLVEHARNLAGFADASHAEYGSPGTPIITLLSCSLQGKQIEVSLRAGSRLARIHGCTTVVERTTCSYGLAIDLQHLASEAGMRVAAVDATGEVRAVERPDHPFFIGTLYQPQLTSTPAAPHPVFAAFLAAAAAATTRPTGVL